MSRDGESEVGTDAGGYLFAWEYECVPVDCGAKVVAPRHGTRTDRWASEISRV